MKDQTLATTSAIVASVALVGCLHPAEERARADEKVGIAATEQTTVTVEDGLAVVRELGERRLLLWASAPDVRIALEGDRTGDWEIEVWNTTSDAELTVSEGTALAVPGTVPTRKRWVVSEPGSELRVAAPDADLAGPWRFALLSDIQEAIGNVQDIFDGIDRENGQRPIRFLLGAGDLTESGSRGQLERFQRELEELDIPYYTTLGNHELGTRSVPWHSMFGRASFRFVYRGVQFSMIDSGSASVDPNVYNWLDDWLRDARDGVHVVAMHIPPLDPSGTRNGGFASRAEAAKLLTRLANGHVDLTLYGHIHSHYAFDNAGIRAHISGGGGAIPERFDGIGRHFMVFEVDAREGVIDEEVVRVGSGG